MFLYLLRALSHSQGFKGYRETKRTCPVNVIPWELGKCQEKVSFLGGLRELLYSWLSFFSFLFRDICFFPANNFNITKSFSSTSFSCFTTLQIMFFLGLEFQTPPASLDLIHFPFDDVWILRVEFLQRFVVVSVIFWLLEILFPMPPLKVFLLC